MVIHASNSKNSVIPSTHQTHLHHNIDVKSNFHLRLDSSAVLSSKAPSCSCPHCKLLQVVLPHPSSKTQSCSHQILVVFHGIPMPRLPLVAVAAKAVEVAVAMAL